MIRLRSCRNFRIDKFDFGLAQNYRRIGSSANDDGNPVVLYDPIADRWIISQVSVSTTPYLQCVAVSQTPDPTGAYYRYAFNYGNAEFPDYGKIGVWPDAYYATFNMFSNSTNGIRRL